MLKQLVFTLALMFYVCVSQNVFAAGSGVIRLELPDAAAVGKGSAFVGEADRPSAVYYNPAGLVQMEGPQVSVGVTALQPRIDYKPFSGDTVQMRRNTFIFPHVYFTTPVNNKIYLGVGESSNFGSGNDWAADTSAGFTRYSTLKSEFENKDTMIVGAYKFSDQLSFGLAADNDDSKIDKEKKLFQDGGANDPNLQFKAKDNNWGYRLAAMYKFNEQHQFGLMYRSKITHKYEGKLYLDNLNNVSTPYATIFGGSSYETKATQKFTLPQSVVLGYSFKPTNKWTFNFDVEWLDWSSVKRQATVYPDETDPTRLGVLNTGNPQARDWTSVWSESIGVEYSVNEQFRVRGGYVYHQSPIDEQTWDTAFPDANSHSFTAGLGYDFNSLFTVDLAYVGVLYEPRKIENSVDNVFGANLDGKYKQFINIGTVTLTHKF